MVPSPPHNRSRPDDRKELPPQIKVVLQPSNAAILILHSHPLSNDSQESGSNKLLLKCKKVTTRWRDRVKPFRMRIDSRLKLSPQETLISLKSEQMKMDWECSSNSSSTPLPKTKCSHAPSRSNSSLKAHKEHCESLNDTWNWICNSPILFAHWLSWHLT